jgi:hypothetical protein
MTHLLVDTVDGLRIVKATEANYFYSDYAVQMVGTKSECEAEKQRLMNYQPSF